MSSVRTQRAKTKRKASAWRLSFTLVAILAFAISSFVTQTHIHHAGAEHAFAAKTVDVQSIRVAADAGQAQISKAQANAAKPEPKDPYAPNEDPANCPLCQEILHAGQYVAPAALLLFTPTATPLGTVVFIHTAIFTARHVSGWRSRAPPLV